LTPPSIQERADDQEGLPDGGWATRPGAGSRRLRIWVSPRTPVVGEEAELARLQREAELARRRGEAELACRQNKTSPAIVFWISQRSPGVGMGIARLFEGVHIRNA